MKLVNFECDIPQGISFYKNKFIHPFLVANLVPREIIIEIINIFTREGGWIGARIIYFGIPLLR